MHDHRRGYLKAREGRCSVPVTMFITNAPSLADRRCRQLQWPRIMMSNMCVASCLVRSACVLQFPFRRLSTIGDMQSARPQALNEWLVISTDDQRIVTYFSKPVSVYTCSHTHTEYSCRPPNLAGYSTPSLLAQHPVKWVS